MRVPTSQPVTATRGRFTQEKRGIECPSCGCQHFRVLSTRRSFGERILRRRECRHCGRRVTTYEAADGA